MMSINIKILFANRKMNSLLYKLHYNSRIFTINLATYLAILINTLKLLLQLNTYYSIQIILIVVTQIQYILHINKSLACTTLVLSFNSISMLMIVQWLIQFID